MNKTYLVVFALLACLTGCVPLDSLNPLYTGKDAIFDQTLLGKWIAVDKDNRDVLEFTALVEDGKNAGYTVSMTGHDEDGKCSRMDFEARLVKIGDRKFLDMVPRQFELNTGSFPLRITQSGSGAAIEPRLIKLAMAGYVEFTGGAQPQANLRAAHWFFRVNQNGKKLRLDWIDDTKFMKAALARKIKLTHALLGEGKDKDIVVTAGTDELQAFLQQHANDDALFSEHIGDLERKPE